MNESETKNLYENEWLSLTRASEKSSSVSHRHWVLTVRLDWFVLPFDASKTEWSSLTWSSYLYHWDYSLRRRMSTRKFLSFCRKKPKGSLFTGLFHSQRSSLMSQNSMAERRKEEKCIAFLTHSPSHLASDWVKSILRAEVLFSSFYSVVRWFAALTANSDKQKFGRWKQSFRYQPTDSTSVMIKFLWQSSFNRHHQDSGKKQADGSARG